jgi:hypothetical protein
MWLRKLFASPKRPSARAVARQARRDAVRRRSAQAQLRVEPFEDRVVPSGVDPFCPRQVSFEIPGLVGVQVTATENAGSLDFTVDALDSSTLTGDLRGLFFQFNESKLGTLQVTGGDGLITGVQIDANAVINLGNGNNMIGAASPFDVGIAFGTPGIGQGDDISGPVHFTLTDAAHDLTTDDFAHLQFGARVTSIGDPAAPNQRKDSEKSVAAAPAAPKAHDDIVTIYEDDASGLDDPRHTPSAVLFNVLGNDVADGPLSVIAFHDGPSHGTVQIAPNGDVLYTPDKDYAGTDSFEYCVSDRPGSQDSATVNIVITAVADVPDIAVQVSPGATVNEINLHVTAAVTDLDGSESIDRFEFAGMPAGVTVVGAPGGIYDVPGTPGTAAGDFTVVLQAGQSYDFDLVVKAIAKETSNGDEEVATHTIDVVLEQKTIRGTLNFVTQDQSIWNPGGALSVDDHRFLGIDEGFDESVSFGPLSAHAGASLKTGFQSDLHVDGGSIDAYLSYDITINTTYNKTTDVLAIDPNAVMAPGGNFQTTGPEGSYKLDFVFNYFIGASVELDAVVDTFTIYGAEIGDSNTENLVDISSTQTLEIPLPFGLSGAVRWPDVDTVSDPGVGTLTSTGTSNEFLHLNLDIDQALADIFLGGVNPFEIPFDIGVADGTVELIDLDLFGGLDFVQSFTLQAPDLEGQIVLENGEIKPFADLVLMNASSYNVNGTGGIEFHLVLKPNATLQNDIDLGINLGYNFDLLHVTGSYDIGIDSGSIDFAVIDTGGNLQVATIDIYNTSPFDLNFQTQDLNFAV